MAGNGPNANTGAINSSTRRHTGGNVGGTNSETVVTRNSDFGSFLGDVPSFTGKQRAEEGTLQQPCYSLVPALRPRAHPFVVHTTQILNTNSQQRSAAKHGICLINIRTRSPI